MCETPWISISRKDGVALRIDTKHFHSLFPESRQPFTDRPSIITVIGKREKATVLRELLGGPDSKYPQEHHGQVHIWLDPCSSANYSTLFVDFELHNHSPAHWQLPASFTGPSAFTKMEWIVPLQHSSKDLGALVCRRVLAPVSNLLCLFAADFHGLRGAAEILAGYIDAHLPDDLSYLTRPRVLVIATTVSKSPDATRIERKLLSLLKQCMRRTQPGEQDVILDATIFSCFHSFQVLPMSQTLTRSSKASLLRRCISSIDVEARESRISNKMLLNRLHVQSLCAAALQHLCRDGTEPMSVIKASRPHGFSDETLSDHLDNLLQNLESEAWLWHLAVPLISSALLLATYPPGSHCKYV